jgi:hypothetical protein
VPMTKWLKAFPAMSSLHPFEAALLDLTVGKGTYASVLGKVDSLRKALQEVRACLAVRLHGCKNSSGWPLCSYAACMLVVRCGQACWAGRSTAHCTAKDLCVVLNKCVGPRAAAVNGGIAAWLLIVPVMRLAQGCTRLCRR